MTAPVPNPSSADRERLPRETSALPMSSWGQWRRQTVRTLLQRKQTAEQRQAQITEQLRSPKDNEDDRSTR